MELLQVHKLMLGVYFVRSDFGDGGLCYGREDIYCGSVQGDMTVPRKCQEITESM
jgi:hypothetical protein